jgi:hypothetical protein
MHPRQQRTRDGDFPTSHDPNGVASNPKNNWCSVVGAIGGYLDHI